MVPTCQPIPPPTLGSPASDERRAGTGADPSLYGLSSATIESE